MLATGPAIVTGLVHARDRAHAAMSYSCGERAGEMGKIRLDSLLFDFATGDVAVNYEATTRGADLTKHGRGKKQVWCSLSTVMSCMW